MDRYTRRASSGIYRIVGYDQYDQNDYFVGEFNERSKALEKIKAKSSVSNGSPTSFSDVFFIYNDQEQLLYRATYDSGVEKIESAD